MIEIGIYLMDNGAYDECYFIINGLNWLVGTDIYDATFINFDEEEIIEKKLKPKTVWMHDQWTHIMACIVSVEEFWAAKPYEH